MLNEMKRRHKQPQPETKTELSEASATQPVNGFQVKPSQEEKDGTVGTVAVRYRDGKVDGSVRDSTWDKLGEVLRATPGALEKLGLRKASAAVSITPEQIQPFYTGIGMLNVFLAIRVAKIDPQIAAQIVPYTRTAVVDGHAVTGELELLSEATAAAINDNLGKLPKWFIDLLLTGGNASLMRLAMVFFQVHAQKLQSLRNELEPNKRETSAIQ